MSGHQKTSEHYLSAREKSLQKKVVHLETQLQVYKSQIDILHEEHKKLEERVLTMESALTKTKKELLETKKEVLDKELAEIQLSEELKSMTLQAEEYKRLFVAERNKNTCGLDKLEALISSVHAKVHKEDIPNRFENFKDLINATQEGFQAQIKMILDKLSDAEDKLCESSPYTEGEVQQTKINKETPSNGSIFKLANLSYKVKGEVDDELRVKAANPLPQKIQTVTDSSKVFKHEQVSCNSTSGKDYVESEPTPFFQFQQTQQSFVQAQANFHHAHPNDTSDGHPFMGKRLLKGVRQEGEDYILIYESRTSIADQEMANRLFLPPNFYNYSKREPCPGCIGCRGIPEKSINVLKNEEKENKTVSTIALASKCVLKPLTSTAASHVFQKPVYFNQLTSSAFEAQEGSTFSPSQMTVTQKLFQGEDQHLFPKPGEEVEEQDEPVIPLPEEIQVVTGDEGLEVTFTEKAKLYRLDSDSSQWKERGIGEVKSQSSFPFSVSPGNSEIPEQKLFWQQPTGPFQCNDDEDIETSRATTPKPSSSTTRQGQITTTPAKPVQIVSSQVEKSTAAYLPTPVTGRRILTAKSRLKGSKKQDDDCILAYEVRSQMADREKAHRLFLPPNFFNYTKHKSCPGCIGCRGIPKRAADTTKQEIKDIKQVSTSATSAVLTSTAASHVFGQSANFGQLTFSSFKAAGGIAFSQSQTKTSHKPFQGAGQQLFAGPIEEVEEQDSDKLHFEPVIPLPEEIQVVTGEEGLEVMFSERAKLYRFDGGSSQWKERGIGEVKLLRHPTSGRGRVLMRREQIKKLCANHNITAEMELKPNVGSDRSWVWYTPVDYAEGGGKPEKLAIKFKTAEAAGNFKQVFDELKELFSSGHLQEKATGCELYKQFLSHFGPAPGTWSCEACYIENTAGNSACMACNSLKPSDGETEPPSKHGEEIATTNVSVIESVEPNTLQNINKGAPTSFFLQSLGGKGLYTSNLFTTGRGESSVDKDTRDDEIDLSLSKTSSPSKMGIITPQPSTRDFQGNLLTGLLFGTGAPYDFTFRMTVWPGSPPQKPRSPLSHTSPTSPVLGEADGKSNFEPVIPLLKEIQVVTGEEGLEVMFSERAKLYRFDGDSSQWKERGIGEVKLLRHPASGRGRVLMRREQIKKLCANHNITAEMELKPNVGSDRSWVWYTPADYAEGRGKPEKLAIKFKTAEAAGNFKQVFDELKELFSSGHLPEKATAENQKATGCELYKQFLSNFGPVPGTWACEVCYVENKAGDSACVACNSLKPNDGETEPPSKLGEEIATTNVSVIESVKPNTLQNLNKDAPTSFFLQSLGGKGLYTSKLFTIGRGESSVDKDTRDDEIDLSPSKTSSPSKKDIITPQPLTQDSQGTLFSGLPFGTGAPCAFTFRMTGWPGSPPQKPRSPLSHSTPRSPVRGDGDGPYFEALIPLPEKDEFRTGEEGQEVLFCERCKLFRYDSDTSQWKERGVGDIKILLNPSSERYRILMRREHVFKICANHVITYEMQLRPFPNSARAWLWTTLGDFSEERTTTETLAVRFKCNEVANYFKEVFDKALQTLSCKSDYWAPSSNAKDNRRDQAIASEDQRARDVFEQQKETGCEIYRQCLSTFAPARGTWSCDFCYVENKATKSTCMACNSPKCNEGDIKPIWKHQEEITTNVPVAESMQATTIQDLSKAAPTIHYFRSPGGKSLDGSKLFTIGRGDSSEEETTDGEIKLTPSKTFLPIKKKISAPLPLSSVFQRNLSVDHPFGLGTSSRFTFTMTFSPDSPPKIPNSPLSHSSPANLVHGDDDGPQFKPLIPLPEKVECRTGEEGQEVLFCERCKLFRYDSGTSQWKERGVGDIKILLNPSSERHRILMRREHVFKLCANHVITSEMQLKPFPNSARAWLWTTLSDFSDETTTAETLAVRFKCNEIASRFKEVFDKTLQTLSSKIEPWTSLSNAKDSHLDKTIVKKNQKESDIFGYEEEASSQPWISASEQEQSMHKKVTEVATSVRNKPSQSGFFFGSPSMASLSFQSVAASSLTDSPFGKRTPDKSPRIKGAGAQLFAASKTEDDSDGDAADGDHPDEPYFEPIIPLPFKIDVKTGEEDEQVMFSHRAKLYRFVAEEKQWKERGIGNIKLLRNARSRKVRVLMRRDRVLKLCANHQITTDMSLQPNAGSDRSWVWSTHADFSEGECKAERLAVRFKNGDIAKQFKEKFEECQEMLKNQASLKPPVQKETVNTEGVKEDLLSEEGSWECDTCMVRNGSDKLVCAACTSPKPGIKDSQDKKSEGKPIFGSGATSSGTGFTFGSAAPSSGTGFIFGSDATLSGKGFVFGSTGTNKGSAKPFFSFGSLNQTQNSSSETVTTFGSLKQLETTIQEQVSGDRTDVTQTDQQTPDADNKQLGNGEKNYVLTADADARENKKVGTTSVGEREAPPKNKIDEKKANSSEERAFLFGSPSISTIPFQSIAASSIENSPFGQNVKTKSKGFAGAGSTLFASQSPGGETHEEEEQEGDHDGPHFEPIISLPEKIDVRKGEQNEEVMFSQRAKLFRFVAEDKQWKERGIGDIKLLRNVRSGKMRVLMLRDHMLQLCANHQITTDMSLQPNAGSDRSWVWSTHADFSEGECKAERLAVRFKNGDIAKQFKEKVEECQEMLKKQASLRPPVQRETVNTEGVKEDLLAKFKGEEGSWECDTCMVRNSSDKLVCAACTNPKPGSQTPQMPAYRGTPSLSFGTCDASSNSGFSFGSTASSIGAGSCSTPGPSQGFSFSSNSSSSGTGFLFGQQKGGENSSKPVFSFGLGSTAPFSFFSTQKENTGAAVDDDGEGGDYSDDQASSDKGNDMGDDSSQTSKEAEVADDGEEGEKRHVGLGKGLLKGWKPENDSWECTICLVRNKSEKLECAACESPKPGVDVNREKTTEGKPLFRFGPGSSFSSVGFSFGTSASSSGAGFSFGPGPTSTGAEFSFGFDGQGGGDGEEGYERQEGVGKGLLKGWKPENDSWECTICLVRNRSEKLECAACASPKPGVDVNREKTTEEKSLFGFGRGSSFSSAGFSFGTSASSSGAGFSFGPGPTSTGAGFSCGFDGQGGGDGEEGDERQEGVGKGLLKGRKPENDSWECTICLVRNKSEKLECAACASPKPGVYVNREKTTEEKSLFGFGRGSSFSSAGFSFGTSASSSGAGFSFGPGPTSTGAGFSFGFDGQGGGDGEEGYERQEGVGKGLLKGWKPENDSWECTICLVRNKSEKLECAACASPKPGVDVNREKTTEEKSLFGFGRGSSFSSAGFSFGTSASSSGAGFSFGPGPTSTGAGFSFGFDGQGGGDGEEGYERQEGVGKGLLKGWKPENDSWECTICLVRNRSEKLECAACASPKPGVDVNREKTTEEKSLFGFGRGSSFSSAGFSFGTSASSSVAGFFFGPGPTSTGAGFSCGFDGQGGGDGEEGDERQEGVGKGLLKGWKPENDSWECTICLVRNKSEKLECAACASPKPGVDVNREKRIEGKPLFGFGRGSSFSSAGFLFGTSASSSGAGFSFGSGPTSTGRAGF